MKDPVVKTQMLIRRPVAEVYEAFINPEITTKFWFTKSSGRLEVGARIKWEWEMFGATGFVQVKKLEENKHIFVEVEKPLYGMKWDFEERGSDQTLVKITVDNFQGDEDQKVAQALTNMDGFANMLASMKAWLEHGLALNLVADSNPDALVQPA